MFSFSNKSVFYLFIYLFIYFNLSNEKMFLVYIDIVNKNESLTCIHQCLVFHLSNIIITTHLKFEHYVMNIFPV